MTGNEPSNKISSIAISRAKSRVAQWLDSSNEGKGIRRSLLEGVDEIARGLADRREWFETRTELLDSDQSLTVSLENENFCFFITKSGPAFSAIVPNWTSGWRGILKNDETHTILTWFLHYARQYIHRSYSAAVLMALWQKYDVVLHPFGKKAIYQKYENSPLPKQTILDNARSDAISMWGSASDEPTKINSHWLKVNTLDPCIHQAIFHFLRANNLVQAKFEGEAVVAFDCALQSIGVFLQQRRILTGGPSRADICNKLGLCGEYPTTAEYAYFIRNNFVAHAGGWRWWDQYELFEDGQLGEISDLTLKAILAVTEIEPSQRVIEPDPASWPEWLFVNWEILWDCVWFDRLS